MLLAPQFAKDQEEVEGNSFIRVKLGKISSSLDLETVIVEFDFGWLPDDHPATLSLLSST